MLEAVVELHLDTAVFCQRVQDHPQEQLPHALKNSRAQNTLTQSHTPDRHRFSPANFDRRSFLVPLFYLSGVSARKVDKVASGALNRDSHFTSCHFQQTSVKSFVFSVVRPSQLCPMILKANLEPPYFLFISGCAACSASTLISLMKQRRPGASAV